MSEPKISCLMVTADRADLAKRAVRCYLQQSYPNKELVVLDNGTEPLDAVLADVPAGELVYEQVERKEGTFIGALRNQSLDLATGDFVVPQWDDDDWYHPDRLRRQADVLAQGFDAVTVKATLMHLDAGPYLDHPYIGILKDGVPPTIMHRRDDDIRFPNLRRTSDTYYLNAWRERRYALMPASDAYLYIRCFHGDNLWGEDHFLRRMRNSVPDALSYAWHRYVRRNVLGHPRFQLTPNAQKAFGLYVRDSKALGLL
ncbi:MAG: glycosyltransferase family 2 protein [Bacteroidota bacterium]